MTAQSMPAAAAAASHGCCEDCCNTRAAPADGIAAPFAAAPPQRALADVPARCGLLRNAVDSALHSTLASRCATSARRRHEPLPTATVVALGTSWKVKLTATRTRPRGTGLSEPEGVLLALGLDMLDIDAEAEAAAAPVLEAAAARDTDAAAELEAADDEEAAAAWREGDADGDAAAGRDALAVAVPLGVTPAAGDGEGIGDAGPRAMLACVKLTRMAFHMLCQRGVWLQGAKPAVHMATPRKERATAARYFSEREVSVSSHTCSAARIKHQVEHWTHVSRK